MDRYMKICGCITSTVTTIVATLAGGYVAKVIVDSIKDMRKSNDDSNSSEGT